MLHVIDTKEDTPDDIMIIASGRVMLYSLQNIDQKLRRAARGKYENMTLEEFALMCLEDIPSIVDELSCT